jgi:hypothetical protein
MWLPTNIPYLIALSATFFLWVGERDRAEREAAGEFDVEAETVMAGDDPAAQPSPHAASTAE